MTNLRCLVHGRYSNAWPMNDDSYNFSLEVITNTFNLIFLFYKWDIMTMVSYRAWCPLSDQNTYLQLRGFILTHLNDIVTVLQQGLDIASHLKDSKLKTIQTLKLQKKELWWVNLLYYIYYMSTFGMIMSSNSKHSILCCLLWHFWMNGWLNEQTN